MIISHQTRVFSTNNEKTMKTILEDNYHFYIKILTPNYTYIFPKSKYSSYTMGQTIFGQLTVASNLIHRHIRCDNQCLKCT